MRKIGKRTLSLLLAVLMVTALFTAVPLTVSAAEVSDEAVGREETINPGDTKTPYISYNNTYYYFTPSRDMPVRFYSDYSEFSFEENPRGVICDANKNILISDDNSGRGKNFSIRYRLKANTKYYFGVKNVNRSYSFYCPVTLEEVPVWEHIEGVITNYNGEDSDVTVPSELDGYTITTIGEGAFRNNNVIKRVNIPASITSIEDGAFYECENLSVVHFAEGSELTTIGQGAFCYCPELAEVNFEDLKNLKTIGSSAFAAEQYRKNKLTYVNLQEGLTTIGAGAFNNSGSGKGFIIIPSTVTDAGCNGINQTAFYMARYNTIIIKPTENIFDIDFDAAMYIPYAACYEGSPVEYQLEHGSNTSPSVGSAYHIKSPYTVTYDANLPDSVTATVPAAQEFTDDVINISSEVPTAGSKREFLGWSTTPNDATPRFQPGDKAAFCADVTLYAVWRDAVTFIDGDDTVAEKDIALMDKPGSGKFTYDNVTAVKDSKVLMGYFTGENGEGTLMFVKDYGDAEVTLADGVAIETVMSAADNEGEVKLYAYWLDAPEIKGTSISLDGDVTTNIYVSLSADISEFQSAVVKINSYTKEFDLTDPKECTVETIDGNSRITASPTRAPTSACSTRRRTA